MQELLITRTKYQNDEQPTKGVSNQQKSCTNGFVSLFRVEWARFGLQTPSFKEVMVQDDFEPDPSLTLSNLTPLEKIDLS